MTQHRKHECHTCGANVETLLCNRCYQNNIDNIAAQATVAENTRVLDKVEEFIQKYRPLISVFDDNCSPDPEWYEELSDELDSLRLVEEAVGVLR